MLYLLLLYKQLVILLEVYRRNRANFIFFNLSLVGISCSSSKENRLTGNTGYISSIMTDTKGCGSHRSPWIISVKPGQTIRLQLIDFAANQHASTLVSCPVIYGYVVERTLGINHTICGGRHRQEELYVSKTNTIEVVLLSRNKGANFLIKYAGENCLMDNNAWNYMHAYINQCICVSQFK